MSQSIFKMKGVRNIFKKTLIFISLTMITLFAIIKPLESNAYYDGQYDPDYYISAQDFYTMIYVPMVEDSDYYYTFDDLESSYGSTAEELISIMVNLIKQYEYEKGYNNGYYEGNEDGKDYVWNLIEQGKVYDAKDMIIGIFDAPLRILEKAFTFEIFGIEVYNIILFVMTMGIVYFVWKRVKK